MPQVQKEINSKYESAIERIESATEVAVIEGSEIKESELEEAVKTAREMYAKAKYKSANSIQVISRVLLFLKTKPEETKDMYELRLRYKSLFNSFLNLKLDSLKKSGSGGEDLKRKEGNLVNYFNGKERIELAGDCADYEAESFEKESGGKEGEFRNFFSRFIEWYKDNAGSKRSSLNKTAEDFGIGFPDKTVGRFSIAKAGTGAHSEKKEKSMISEEAALGLQIAKEIFGGNVIAWREMREHSCGDIKKSESADKLNKVAKKYSEILGNEASPDEEENIQAWIARISKTVVKKQHQKLKEGQNKGADPKKTNEARIKLMENLNFSRLSEDQQKNLIGKMTETVLKKMLLGTMKKLDIQDRKKYQNMIDNESGPEEADNFLKERVQGYEEMVKKIIADFIEMMKKEI